MHGQKFFFSHLPAKIWLSTMVERGGTCFGYVISLAQQGISNFLNGMPYKWNLRSQVAPLLNTNSERVARPFRCACATCQDTALQSPRPATTEQ